LDFFPAPAAFFAGAAFLADCLDGVLAMVEIQVREISRKLRNYAGSVADVYNVYVGLGVYLLLLHKTSN
jgi:hypothetical protein